MIRIIALSIVLAFLTACQNDRNAKGPDSKNSEIRVSEAATAIDSPGLPPKPVKAVKDEAKPQFEKTVAMVEEPPQDTLRTKSIKQKVADNFLKKHVQDESIAKQVKVYLEQDEKVSAVRTVSKSTKLELPEAKAFIDSLEVLMGTDKLNVSPRVRVQRKKTEKKAY